MKLCKVRIAGDQVGTAIVHEGQVHLLSPCPDGTVLSLSDVLHDHAPAELIARHLDATAPMVLDQATLLAPLDRQEVWAAGVTYRRSREARERESTGAARFYDLVYSASRPELFFKATPARVVGPGGPIRIRRDSRWTVPEPELALVLSPHLDIVGYTIGNDMSARDIEGENPLYLPQAKVYDHCCAWVRSSPWPPTCRPPNRWPFT